MLPPSMSSEKSFVNVFKMLSHKGSCLFLTLVLLAVLYIKVVVHFYHRPSSGSATNYSTVLEVGPRSYKSDVDGDKDREVSPKIAFVFSGSARSFNCPHVHWSIRSHVIDALGGDSHVFVRMTQEDNLNYQRTGDGQLEKTEFKENELIETIKVLNPKVVEQFSFRTQLEEMKRYYHGWRHEIYRKYDQRRYSMYFQRAMSYKMVTAHEKAHSMKFDWVVLIRLDAMWLDPLLPIASYAADRVWLTEQGFSPFNDQFMLMPRQFSDWLYDLDVKVSPGVLCLGGPDIEKWKCNASELAARSIPKDEMERVLSLCCNKNSSREDTGYSETIQLRHLKAGEIPVAIGYFPMLLTRYYKDSPKKCHYECLRLIMNRKEEYPHFSYSMYPYFAPSEWPDTREKAISTGDYVLCELLTKPEFSTWNPRSALEIAEASTSSAINGIATPLDYSKKLDEEPNLPKDILLNPRKRELWRIQPSWNVDGCLTYNFLNKTHTWSKCLDRTKKKGGLRHHATQLFYLTVYRRHPFFATNPNAEQFGAQAHIANTTRVIIALRNDFTWDYLGEVMCLTADSIRDESRLTFRSCTHGGEESHKQLFLPVEGTLTGTSTRTSVGTLRMAVDPNLCVMKSKDYLSEISAMPIDNSLVLSKCGFEGRIARMGFEFELVERFV